MGRMTSLCYLYSNSLTHWMYTLGISLTLAACSFRHSPPFSCLYVTFPNSLLKLRKNNSNNHQARNRQAEKGKLFLSQHGR